MVTPRTRRRGFSSHVYKKVDLFDFDPTKTYVVFRNQTFGLVALNLTEHFEKQWKTCSTEGFAAKLGTLKKWFGEAIRIDAKEPLVYNADRPDCYIEGLMLTRATLGRASVRTPTRR